MATPERVTLAVCLECGAVNANPHAWGDDPGWSKLCAGDRHGPTWECDFIPAPEPDRCPECEGEGYTKGCDWCGSGEVDAPCVACRGSGVSEGATDAEPRASADIARELYAALGRMPTPVLTPREREARDAALTRYEREVRDGHKAPARDGAGASTMGRRAR